MTAIRGRRLTVGRERQKLRGLRRRGRALRAWAASFAGFFPPVTRNGLGIKNWHTKTPVGQRLVSGPEASRAFRRACMAAMLDVVEHLRRARPATDQIRVVALIDPDDLFRSSVDVFWGDEDFFAFFARTGRWQAWTPITDPTRSLLREWRLGAPLGEAGFSTTERWDEDEPAHSGELWAVGDVAGLRR